MTAEDIAKLVDAEKPTVNPDGTYTLTRTETILDAEGNPQTRTTYITIQGSKVTTKTTTELTITRKKEKQEGNEQADFEAKYPDRSLVLITRSPSVATASPSALHQAGRDAAGQGRQGRQRRKGRHVHLHRGRPRMCTVRVVHHRRSTPPAPIS